LPEALLKVGATSEIVVWDDPSVTWDRFDAVLLRSTWDYHERRNDFLDWARSRPVLINPYPVIEWNTDKRYLSDLAASGINIVPTIYVNSEIPNISFEECVIKPTISAGSRNTARYTRANNGAMYDHIADLTAQGHTVMVQPYIASVDMRGETALIYFAGEYSHAIRKGPILQADTPATSEFFAPEEITPRVPDAGELALAEAALDSLQWPRQSLAYARVDVVRTEDGEPMLLELELTEPSLFLEHRTGAAASFAEAVAAALQSRAT